VTFEIRDAQRSTVFQEFVATYFNPELVAMARRKDPKYIDDTFEGHVRQKRTACRSVARDEQQLMRLSNKYGIQIPEETFRTFREQRSTAAQELLLFLFDNQDQAMTHAEDVVKALGN
jgi:hypothetical protein